MGAISKELRKWYRKPFLCKPPAGRSLRATEAKPCSYCGSVVVIGGNAIIPSRKYDRLFCDIECANEYKKWHNHSREYREKSGIVANERARQNAKIEDQKRRVVCCTACGCAFVNNTGTKRFCDKCRLSMSRLYARTYARKRFVAKPPKHCVTCERCGTERMSHSPIARFCSERCRKKAAEANREHVKRSKAFGSVVSLHAVVKKYRSKCASCGVICKKPVGDNNPYEATIDHVLPLSKGGLHMMSNVQLLCRQCNTIKNDTVHAGVQLMLQLE